MNVVILNDTSYKPHHGCELVMSNIKSLLKANGFNILFSLAVGKKWSSNKKFLSTLKKANFVLVNGEGTIHHSQERGLELVKIAKFAKEAYNIPSILINSTFQENSKEIIEYTKYFDLIFVRESFSQNELLRHGIKSEVVPDMTFYSKFDKNNTKQEKAPCVTDSVYDDLSQKLLSFCKQNNFQFIPINSFPKINKDIKIRHLFKYILFYFKFFYIFYTSKFIKPSYRKKRILFYTSSYENYINTIAFSKSLLVARYHALCFAIKTQTPFLAIQSNSFKIESMLKDIGIGNNRIIEEFDENMLLNIISLSEEEKQKIEQYTEDARLKIINMFSDIKQYVNNYISTNLP